MSTTTPAGTTLAELLEETGGRNAWSTPFYIFEVLDREFSFTVDACALPWNQKLPNFWGPKDNGLIQNWSGHRVWCNPPPYGKGLLKPWVDKALELEADVTVMLLPSRTEMDWFHALYNSVHVEIKFYTHRIQFTAPAGVKASSNNERSFLAIIRK